MGALDGRDEGTGLRAGMEAEVGGKGWGERDGGWDGGQGWRHKDGGKKVGAQGWGHRVGGRDGGGGYRDGEKKVKAEMGTGMGRLGWGHRDESTGMKAGMGTGMGAQVGGTG